MPIYEFQCEDCGAKKEILFKSTDDTVDMTCDACGSVRLRRLLSASNFCVTGNGPSGAPAAATRKTHQCAGGSCTTYDIPGPR